MEKRQYTKSYQDKEKEILGILSYMSVKEGSRSTSSVKLAQ